jgi:hypothetical protein
MSLGKIALVVAILSFSFASHARPHRQRARAHAARKQQTRPTTSQPKAEVKKSSGDLLAGLPGF